MDSGGVDADKRILSYERSWSLIAGALLIASFLLILRGVTEAFAEGGSSWDRLLTVALRSADGVAAALALGGALALLRIVPSAGALERMRRVWFLTFILGSGITVLSLYAACRVATDSHGGSGSFRAARVVVFLAGVVLSTVAAWIARPAAFAPSQLLPDESEEPWSQ